MFTDQDIGKPEGAPLPQPPQNPPLPTSAPPVMGMPMLPGGPPRPMHFPGAYPQHQAMRQPPLPAPRSHGQLVQDFKDLLLESKVCTTLTHSLIECHATHHMPSARLSYIQS